MKNTYLIILIAIILTLAAMMVVGPFNSGSSANEPFEQKAYFVSDSSDRVFTVYADTMDLKRMKRHGNRLMYTPGQYTAVYFYEERSDASVDLSRASGFEQACGKAWRTGCVARYMRYPDGREKLIQHPSAALPEDLRLNK